MSEHDDKFEAIAQQIGIWRLRNLVPFNHSEIDTALRVGDMHLNTLPLKKWDRMHVIVKDYAGRAGIRSWSLSDTVCVLKHVARYHIGGLK